MSKDKATGHPVLWIRGTLSVFGWLVAEKRHYNKGCTREFLYNYIAAFTTNCIEIPAYTLYFPNWV